MGHKKGVQKGGPRETLHLSRQVSATLTARLVEGQARVGHRFFRRGLLPGLRGAHQLHRKSLRCTAPSNPTSNPLILASFCLRRSSRLVPTCGVQISRFLPAFLRRKQAHHPSCPSRTGGGVFGRCRCAPLPDPFGLGARPATPLTLLARHRAARDSLKGSRRSRALRPPSFRQLSHRARLFDCTFSLPCSGLSVCCLGRIVSRQ